MIAFSGKKIEITEIIGQDIVVDGFKTNLPLNAGTTDSNGKAVFYVGATARITIQNKSGSYEVTCAYQ